MASRPYQSSGAPKTARQRMAPAREIEAFLEDLGLVEKTAGPDADFIIERPMAVHEVEAGGLTFLNKADEAEFDRLAPLSRLLLLAPISALKIPFMHEAPKGRWLYCANPRLAFTLTLQHFFEAPPTPHRHATALVDETAKIAADVSIGAYAVIGAGVDVGARTSIGTHATLHEGTVIGDDCQIGAGSRLGGPGFGYERDEHGHPQAVPQLGRLIIGDHVSIGENVTINRAALTKTIIHSHVKIDDQVYIAHNVRIDDAVIIMAGVRIMGSAVIGAKTELNPGALIAQGVQIGQAAIIAMGASVLDNIPERSFAAGVPAIVRNNRQERQS